MFFSLGGKVLHFISNMRVKSIQRECVIFHFKLLARYSLNIYQERVIFTKLESCPNPNTKLSTVHGDTKEGSDYPFCLKISIFSEQNTSPFPIANKL